MNDTVNKACVGMRIIVLNLRSHIIGVGYNQFE